MAIAEENLRQETAINEEQRAQISILKQGIEVNLEKFGLKFSRKGQSKTSDIDGFLELIRS